MTASASLGAPSPRRAAWWQAVLMTGATGVAFWPALRGSWLWDDGLELTDNPLLKQTSGWWKEWTVPAGLDYLPLKGTLQWLEWQGWGAQPLGYHLVNVGLHLLGAFLLWRVLAQLGVAAAWWGGLLFAVHPAVVESVAWISELKNVLALPPLLLSFSAFLKFDAGGRTRTGQLYAAIGWFAAALLCKASAVMFPVCLLVYIGWRHGRLEWRDGFVAAPFFAVSALCGMVTLEFQWHRAMATVPIAGEWADHVAQSGWTLLAYIRTAFLPYSLAPVYGPGWSATSGRAWLGIFPWLAVAGLFLWFWRHRATWGRHAGFAGAWFVLSLLPVLGFIPMAYLRVSPRADHLEYLALAGWAGGVAAAWGAIRVRFLADNALHLLAAAIVLVFIDVSHSYAARFRSEEALWTYGAAKEPDAWVARSNLGKVLLNQGRLEAAESELAAAARLQPDSAEVRTNWGNALERLNRPAEALAQYQAAVQIEPEFPGGHYNLGRAWLQRAHNPEAITELRKAVALDPGYVAAHNNLGLALARSGDLPAAEAAYRAALWLAPSFPEAHLNLGNAYFRDRRINDAIAEYRAALRADPSYGAAQHNLDAVLTYRAQHTPAP